MVYVLVKHKVKDFETWKTFFDQHEGMRKKSGSRGGHIFRHSDDPHDVVVLLEWNNLANARNFSTSDDLKKVMMQAGVVGKPDLSFLEEAD